MAEIDKRSGQDILSELVARSVSYTPEWRFDPAQPDIGAALAMAYADMAAGTVKKLNQLPLKNRIAFHSAAGASLLPAEASRGYVSFSLSSEDCADTEVPAGTVLSAPSGAEDTVYFETTEDVLVSPAKIDAVFCTDDGEDYIGEYTDFREKGLLLFDRSPDNLQRHVMTIRHPFLFDIRGSSVLRLRFFRRGGVPVPAAVIAALADAAAVSSAFYAGEELGFVPFSEVREQDGALLLCRTEELPPPSADENGDFLLRFTVKDIAPFGDFAFMRVTGDAAGATIPCDIVTDGSSELRRERFFPFGERFQLYNEVYFGADEVLNKRGAEITLSFDVSFLPVPLENPLPDEEIQYKWIADKSDFKESREYEITITEVIWEYYNGYGWRRLFPDDAYSDLFSVKEGVTEAYRTMSFLCPEDIAPAYAGMGESYCIRARVLKAENLYKLRGHYLSPSVRNLSFAYSYAGDGRAVTSIECENNLTRMFYDPAALPTERGFAPFVRTGADKPAVYLGFGTPPRNGPYRILWNIRENPAASGAHLLWEYYGGGKWHPLHLVDETLGFTRDGFTVFLDNHLFTPVTLFGREMYYIRITDAEEDIRSGRAYLPIVESLCENTVRAVNTDSREEEYFTMNVHRENASFTLAKGSVLELELYVDETDTLSRDEIGQLEAEGRLSRTTDEAGMTSQLWVLWRETDNFIGEAPSSRVYALDRSGARITFGTGRHGRIPAVSNAENIRVLYTTGGGKRSNVQVGQVRSLERSVGFITGVSNPKPFCGGQDTETLARAMERSSTLIRTQGKAVSVRDFEELTRIASRDIRDVRCCPGWNLSGEREPGALTLVILKDADAEFSRVRDEVLSYLRPRIACGITAADKLFITEPEFVRLNVRAEISVVSLSDICGVRRAVEERLRALLDAARSGEGMAASLGRLPDEQQLRSCILSLSNVKFVRSMYITCTLAGAQGLSEIDPDRIRRKKYILPENGTHDISITLA